MDQFIATIVLGVLALLGKALNDWIKANITPQKLAHVSDLARVAVLGAERTGILGEDKYTAASLAVVDGAKRFGIKLSEAEVSAYIHSALAELTGIEDDADVEAAA